MVGKHQKHSKPGLNYATDWTGLAYKNTKH